MHNISHTNVPGSSRIQQKALGTKPIKLSNRYNIVQVRQRRSLVRLHYFINTAKRSTMKHAASFHQSFFSEAPTHCPSNSFEQLMDSHLLLLLLLLVCPVVFLIPGLSLLDGNLVHKGGVHVRREVSVVGTVYRGPGGGRHVFFCSVSDRGSGSVQPLTTGSGKPTNLRILWIRNTFFFGVPLIT